jgi:cell division protein ZipA
MEPDLLRLVLFVAGVVLVLGIYFWDRHKRARKSIQAIHRDREFSIGETNSSAETEDITVSWQDASNEPATVDASREELGNLVREIRRGKTGQTAAVDPGQSPMRKEEEEEDLFRFTAEEDVAAGSELPVMILQLNLRARGARFGGDQILQAMQEVDLQPGDMQIFHRYVQVQGKPKVLFSLASLVEPGFFPLDAMDGFSTPGLTLFAQLPTVKDGLAVFSDMLFTAERLAALLNAELQDAGHSVLSKQTIEHIRSEILEHRRKLQLASKRR